MASEYEPEFTHNQGLVVGLAGMVLFFGLLFFVEDHQAELGFGAFVAIVSTIVIRRDLVRRRWFQLFIAAVALAHVGLFLLNPGSDFSRGGFKLFVLCEVVLVLGAAFALEWLVSSRGKVSAK
jgi:hypothetical protein